MIKSIREIYKNELNNVSTFYREVIELWLKCKQDLHEEAIKNPGQEIIWNNECITYNNDTSYFKDWIQSGIITVSNLYKENGSLMSMSDLQTIIEKPRWYNVGVPCSFIIDAKKVERIKMLRYKK